MHESDSQSTLEKSGWSALPTITTFDRGKTYSQKLVKESSVVSKKLTPFSPSSVFVESLVEQLCKLFEKDPLSQKKLYALICKKLYDMKLIDKTYKLEEFQFMRTYYQRALFHLLTVSNSPAIDRKLESFLNQSPSYLSLPPAVNSGVFDRSRYQEEFEEIEFIARGGFGRVFRVRNKIDGCEYAVKKICLRYHGDEQFLRSLGEVRTLAKLDHSNIVAYKAAWFEPLVGVVEAEDCSSGSSSKVSLDPEPQDDGLESSASRKESGGELEDDSGGIVFANGGASRQGLRPSVLQDSGGYHAVGSGGAAFQHNLQTDCGGKVALGPKYDGSLCDHSSGSSNKVCHGKKVTEGAGVAWAVLHIQMQLYEESLRAWLDLRNEALQQHGALRGDGVAIALHIFLGILKGVEYMHSVGVVHHDLKPSNIFVEGYASTPTGASEGRRQVRVGDFGLACHHLAPHQPPPRTVGDHALESPGEDAVAVAPVGGSCFVHLEGGGTRAKEGIGTRLYAAPEQLEGHCNSMSDTFSLAIILFELLQPLFTTMERVKVISALRSTGNVPDDFQLAHPTLASLIKDMLSPNPPSRPSMEEISRVLHAVLPGYECEETGKRNKWGDSQSVEGAGGSGKTVRVTTHWVQECHSFSSGWRSEEVLFEERECGSEACSAARVQQGRTICRLRKDLCEKDRVIEQLKSRIRELERSLSPL